MINEFEAVIYKMIIEKVGCFPSARFEKSTKEFLN